jgi:hypothetical protein
MPFEENAEQPDMSYNWDDVSKEQTKSAAARDFLEALEEQHIDDEIEIKQEIVLDPNE